MNKFEETRNREIKDAFKAFAEHQATLKQYGELEILDWRRPGTGWYRVRYVFDREGNRIYISGDLGEAVVWPTWPATLAEIRKVRKKPAHTSDVRWRIELRRRRNADYYASCGCIP